MHSVIHSIVSPVRKMNILLYGMSCVQVSVAACLHVLRRVDAPPPKLCASRGHISPATLSLIAAAHVPPLPEYDASNNMQGRSSQAPFFQGNAPRAYPYAPSAGAFAAQAAAAALSNPYAQFQCPQAPHYAQAYAQFRPPGATTSGMTADGYTLSSTYVPGSYNASTAASTGARPPVPQKPTYRGPVQPHWYQPGDCRCSKSGCSFSGSKKAVEIHMMDRHLIYPPGWEKRKKRDDWDADPSLKG